MKVSKQLVNNHNTVVVVVVVVVLDLEPDHQDPPAPERGPQDTGGQRNMSYASISSIHVPPGANKLAEPRFTT